jgi:uncharacterized protein YkwD
MEQTKAAGRIARWTLPLAIAAVALAAPFHSPPAAAADVICADADLIPSETALVQFNAATLCLVNQERTSRGLTALSESPKLDSAAQVHSSEMNRLGFFGHDSPGGAAFQSRIIETGYLAGASRWFVGQNLAWGSLSLGTPRALTSAWMNSPEHRANILEPSYRDIGIGSTRGSPNDRDQPAAIIVTHDFGRIHRGRSKCAKTAKKRLQRKRRCSQ